MAEKHCAYCVHNMVAAPVTQPGQVPKVVCTAPPGNALSVWQGENMSISRTNFDYVAGELWDFTGPCPSWKGA